MIYQGSAFGHGWGVIVKFAAEKNGIGLRYVFFKNERLECLSNGGAKKPVLVAILATLGVRGKYNRLHMAGQAGAVRSIEG